MIFTNSQTYHDAHIAIGGTKIKRVYVSKFLGVLIDCNLSWKDHVINLSKKLSKSLAVLHKTRHVLNRDALYTIYRAIFLPYLNYCIEVWGNSYQSHLFPLFRKQKKAIRIICNASYLAHTSPLFDQLKTFKLPNIVKFYTGVFMYKAFSQTLPSNLQSYFSFVTSTRYSTKRVNNFKQNYVRTRKRQLCISTAGVKLWNSFTEELKYSKSLNQFKKMYKQYLLSLQSNLDDLIQ